MTDIAAPPVLAFRRRSTLERLVLDPALEIGAGGEAVVYGLPGDAALVAKLYRQPTLERARKLARMIEAPPPLAGDAALAWPVELLTDPNGGRFAGFLMPRAEGPRIFEFYNPVSRRRAAPLFDWGLLHRAGVSLSAAFDALHGAGYVVGDVNESNILLSPDDASVTLVDADSFQVRDRFGTVHRSGVGKAEFTPPELQGARFADVDRAPEHDRFGLAVLLFLLLMEGTHPFAQRLEGDAESLPVEERIRRGLYPYALPDDDCRPTRLAPPLETLHPGLQALFARCFVDGHADPAARPSAAEWREALALAEAELRACDQNPRHRFAAHVPFCPWCHRRRLLQGRDPFPASVAQARATDGVRLPVRAPRVVAATPAAAAPAAAARVPGIPVTILPQPVAVAPSSGFLAQLGAALPPWLAGPTALGSPLPWIAPAVLTVFYTGSGELRILALAVGFVALRSLFRSGVGSFTERTAGWIVALLFLWFLLNGSGGGASHAADDYDDTAVVQVEPQPDPPVRLDAFPQHAVDTPPVQRNPEEIGRDLSNALQVLQYPLPPDGASIAVRFVVDVDGTVDPATVRVLNDPPAQLIQVAEVAVRGMLFEPGRKSGVPVPVWTVHTVEFPPPQP